MILEQHYLGCLAQASYFIADTQSGIAVVVDPRRDVNLYHERAREHGVEIRHVILTHFHADFLAGHLELQKACKATIHLGAAAEADYDFEPLREGDSIELGPEVRLSILETPGHTPESITVAVHDSAAPNPDPHAVLTGDCLFIGDVGRPDLLASVGMGAEELAGMLYESLHTKLMTLPDETLVYPGHGAGSMCGKNLSTDTVSTIGAQRASNYALQARDRAHFVELVTANQVRQPKYFAYDADLNRRERAVLDEVTAGAKQSIGLEDLLREMNAGAQVLDTRDADDYAAGHLPGSINVGLGGKFATWSGAVLDPARPIFLITESGREAEAVTRLARIGFDGVRGTLEGGAAALSARPEILRRHERLAAGKLDGRLKSSEDTVVLDVRQPGEWSSGHIPGAVHIPLGELQERTSEVPAGREIVLQCKGGYRSSVAAGILEQVGFERLVDLEGGFDAWEASGGSATPG